MVKYFFIFSFTKNIDINKICCIAVSARENLENCSYCLTASSCDITFIFDIGRYSISAFAALTFIKD
nr:MAG TPA: hypothetical protein [Caudoviricetes sp.]